MGRIRTVKPEFYRHEALQDLEKDNPGSYPMLVFSGLWTVCDKAGRFEWKPRTLKLDILPFLPFDMADTLQLLVNAKQVVRYRVGNTDYGWIPTFEDHQRITGKEAQSPARFPEPPSGSNGETPVKRPPPDSEDDDAPDLLPSAPKPLSPLGNAPAPEEGNNGEAPEKHPDAQEGKGIGKGREGEKEEEGNGFASSVITPSRQAAICIALKSEGIGLVNPGNATLLELVKQGAEIDMFVHAARAAVKAEKGTFAYVLGTVAGQMHDAKAIAARARASPAPAPATETPRQRAAREEMEQWAPRIAAQAPGAAALPFTIDMEAPNGTLNGNH